MSITYPLTIPYPSPAHMRVTQQNIVAVSQSQFTATQQRQQWPGEWFEIEATLPKMTAADAATWRGFMAGLRGRAGTFMCPVDTGVPIGGASAYVNRLTYASEYNTVQWSAASATGVALPTFSAVSVVNPAGGSTAMSISFPALTLGQFSNVSQYCNVDARGKSFVGSVYAQSGSGLFVLTLTFDAGLSTQYQVSAQFIVGPSWTRYYLVANVPNNVRGRNCNFALGEVASTGSVGSQTITFFGAQLENGTTPSAFNDNNPVVLGSGQAGLKTLTMSGWSADLSGQIVFNQGDYFQIGQHIYMATNDSVAGATQTVDVFPALRADALNGARIVYLDPMGLFSLATNDRTYDRSPGYPFNVYDYSFKASEAF